MSTKQQLSFLLYHGSSTLHLEAFRLGTALEAWPHKEAALGLLRETWCALKHVGQEPEWFVQRVIDQATGHSNWRHGSLYVTPSKLSAVRYADGGSAYGGELLTFCHDAVRQLRETDEGLARDLAAKCPSIVPYLEGGGEPILLEIGDLRPEDLSAECGDGDVEEMVRELEEDEWYREGVGQQLNFAIRPGRGLIKKVYKVYVASPGDPLTRFQLEEIRPTSD